MKIKFLGAVKDVTGSKHLVVTMHGKKILFDCGMYQGKGMETFSLNRKLGFDPQEIDHIILSHAHIDHSGLIPYAYKLGFRGSVVCTNATRDLCSVMLADAGFIQENDTRTFNKKRALLGQEPVEPLYTKADAMNCIELFIGVSYNRKFAIDAHTKVKFTNSGHMLGSSIINLDVIEEGIKKTIAYTGDIGRPSNRILKAPAPFPQADVLIAESTYGDRLHKDMGNAELDLLEIVKETCVDKRGKLIIPSFSVGRTQEIVYSLNNFYNEHKLPKIEVYVDSPLAINATEVFRLHPECFNKNILEIMDTDPDPFGFDGLYYIRNKEASKRLNSIQGPCIIISASGMMEAGRIKHHLANNIDNYENTILAVGYCAPTTLGARILRGDKEVSIHGKVYPVNAEIRRIDSYSGHGDYNEMIDYLGCQDKKLLKNVFLVHGEEKTIVEYKNKLQQAGFKNVSIPTIGDVHEF